MENRPLEMGANMRFITIFIMLVVLSAVLAASCGGGSAAAWQQNGLGVAVAEDSQETPCLVSLGDAGTIIFWADRRNGSFDIYAQRISADGALMWAAGGVLVCGEAYDQQFPTAVADGAGGAIVVWQDGRQGDDGVDLYAQKMRPDGTAQWQTSGMPVSTHLAGQLFPPIAFSQVVAPDGAGGAIVAWRDNRSDVNLGNTEIFAQRINASGEAMWTTNGIKVLSFGGRTWTTRNPIIVPDGTGGAIVAWQDGRNSSTSGNDIYAQRLTPLGAAMWATNGVAICGAPGEQGYPDMIDLPGAEAVVVWEDKRSGNYDIYAQRINASGAALWDTGGRLIMSAVGDQRTPRVAAGPDGSVFFAWADGSSGAADTNIYAQKSNTSGALQWNIDGVAVCAAQGWQGRVRMCAGDSGSLILSWTDNRGDPSDATYEYDIYSQCVDAGGSSQWQADGLPVAVAQGTQRMQQCVPDGAGGAYVVWEDDRNAGDWDVYAQRVTPAAAPQSVHDIKEAKGLSDGRLVTLPARIITAAFDGFFYVQEADRSAAIRVNWPAAVNEGDSVLVTGYLAKSIERCINAISVDVQP